jgi:AAA15 family ATPase/GTPase
MLKEFRVTNFKGFKDELVFDLSKTNGYEFNPECIKNDIVNCALVYGYNGVGKSNLALAIFDVIEHLTDKNTDEREYQHYLNAYNDDSEVAKFVYEFFICSKKVVYEYWKTDYLTLVYERFLIDNTEVVLFDRRNSNNQFKVELQGAETLTRIINDSSLSALKFIKNNTSLVDNEINGVFGSFFKFIESMLFFKSLDTRTYLGYDSGTRTLDSDIIERNNHGDLERFLNEASIECKLTVIELPYKKILAFDFGKRRIPYHEIASTGTNALVLFYFWLQRIRENQVSFVFIDEYDAFYHHELSAIIIRELKKSGIQFVLTTHNISLMKNDLLRPDCYFLMGKNKIKSLSNCTQKELREAHNIEKMYKAGLFDVE